MILIRHGQYKHSEDKGDEEHKLTPLGREQANITGQRLREYLKFLKENLVDKWVVVLRFDKGRDFTHTERERETS